LCKVANEQTNNDDYITTLVEFIRGSIQCERKSTSKNVLQSYKIMIIVAKIWQQKVCKLYEHSKIVWIINQMVKRYS